MKSSENRNVDKLLIASKYLTKTVKFPSKQAAGSTD
jgi:hypothetical protein